MIPRALVPFFPAFLAAGALGGIGLGYAYGEELASAVGDFATTWTDDTLRPFAPPAVGLVTAHAVQSDGALDQLVITLQPRGLPDVDLEGLILRLDSGDHVRTLALAGPEGEGYTLTPLRNRDGSLAEGLLNQTDLVEIQAPLDAFDPRPSAGSVLGLVILPERGVAADVRLLAPRMLSHRIVTLEIEDRV